MLRDRLSTGEVVELHADSHAEEASAEHDHDTPEAPEMETDDDRVEDEAFSDEPLSDDTEYVDDPQICLLYTSPSPRDMRRSRMPSSA